MSKIICDMCGTAYPDTAQQCPICGCAKPVDAQILSGVEAVEEAEDGYTYVKGGRFSESNVRKRNNMAKAAAAYEEDDYEENEEPKESNRGLTIAIIVLLLAIIAVAAYIYIRFFGPSGSDGTKVEATKPQITTTVQQTTTAEPTTPPETTPEVTTTVETTPDLSCTGITIKDQALSFDTIGSFFQIEATAEPANTPDQILFTSSDEKVATVDASGKVTAIGDGTATITVSCGSVSTQCAVTVYVPKQDATLKFNTFSPFEGSLEVGGAFNLKLRDANKNVLEVTNWTSSKPGVATVNDEGYVVAKSAGVTIISCEYKGWVYECKIIVN